MSNLAISKKRKNKIFYQKKKFLLKGFFRITNNHCSSKIIINRPICKLLIYIISSFDFSINQLPFYIENQAENMMEKLKDFFTSKHLKIVHKNHQDILFNGHLYFYNDVDGKIELHSLEEIVCENCNPVPQNEHLILTRKQSVDQDKHNHGPNCGHPIVHHSDHIDYLVNEALHFPHEDHCDYHGELKCIEQAV